MKRLCKGCIRGFDAALAWPGSASAAKSLFESQTGSGVQAVLSKGKQKVGSHGEVKYSRGTAASLVGIVIIQHRQSIVERCSLLWLVFTVFCLCTFRALIPLALSKHQYLPHEAFLSLSAFLNARLLISTCIFLLISNSQPFSGPTTPVINAPTIAWLQYGLPEYG